MALKGNADVENLPKKAPKNMISRIDNPVLRDRIYRASFRSMLKIIQKAREHGIPVVKANPRGTPSTCPHRRREWEGDAAAVINIEKRALNEGRMPPGPTPEVAWLPMGAWARRKSLGNA